MPVLIAYFRESSLDWNDLRRSVITNCKEAAKERVIRWLCRSDRNYVMPLYPQLSAISKIQLVVYYQCCVLIG